MKPIPFSYRAGKPGRPGSVTLVLDNEPMQFTEGCSNYTQIVNALKNGAWSALCDLVNPKAAIARYTNGLVQIMDNNELLYDGKPLHNALVTRILDTYNSGGSYEFLTNFLNKVQLNPIESARDEIYLFLDACNLPIQDDGDFLAYKVVRHDYLDKHSRTMDNSIGQKPEMDPAACDPDRNNECSRGLHFCSRSYVSQFRWDGDRLMIVKINPANVVAIPRDYNNAKGRAWTYEVVDEILDDSDIKGSVKPFEVNLTPTAADRAVTKSINPKRSTGSKLSEDEVLGIHKMLREDFSYAIIGAKYGVHRRTIERIAKGEAWKNVKPKIAGLKGGDLGARERAQIRKLRKNGRSLQSLADEFKCSRHRIEKICNH